MTTKEQSKPISAALRVSSGSGGTIQASENRTNRHPINTSKFSQARITGKTTHLLDWLAFVSLAPLVFRIDSLIDSTVLMISAAVSVIVSICSKVSIRRNQ